MLSEARIVFRRPRTLGAAATAIPNGAFRSRTAIFRAREAYRERVRSKTAAERQLAGVEASIGLLPLKAPLPGSPRGTTTEPADRVPHEPGAVTAGEFLVQTVEAESWLTDPVWRNRQSSLRLSKTPTWLEENADPEGELAFADEFQPTELEAGGRATAAHIGQAAWRRPGLLKSMKQSRQTRPRIG